VSSLFTIDSNDFAGTQWQVSDGPDTDFADNMSAGYDRFSRAMSITMIQENYVAELSPIIDQVKDATGERLMNPGGELQYIQGRTGGWDRYEEKINELRERAEPLGIQVPDREEIERRIKQRLPQIEARYFDTTNRQTTGGFWGELLGSAAAELKSAFLGPAELLPGFVAGAGYKFGVKALARAGLIDGLASAGVVGYTQPAVAAMREKYGLKYDFNDFVAATGGAFVGGAAFRVVGQGGFDASRAIGDKINPARAIGREMLETVDRLSPEQIADAFRVMSDNGLNVPEQARGALNELEREVDLATNSPFKDSDMDAQNENAQRVAAETINVINEGQPRIDLPPTTREVAELDVHHYDNLDQEIYRFDPAEIEVDARVFQFKEGGDEFGVTERLQGVKNWDPALSGHVVVYEFADGRRFIADGHQRLGLAKRIKSQQPFARVRLYGRLLKESDGVTPQDAMVDAALTNIAQGTGTAVDAAKVLRIDPKALSRRLPPRSPLVRTAQDLVALSDEAFGMVVNEIVPANYGAIVGRLVTDLDFRNDTYVRVPNFEKQVAIMRVLADTDPSNATQAEAIVRQAMDTEFTVATQDTLFGEEMLVESLFKERARVLDETIKILRKDRAVFNSLVENETRIEAGGNTLSTDQNAAKAKTDGQAIQTLQITANRKGPLSDALTEAAKRFKETGRAAPAARDFADAVRGGIERGDINGVPKRGEVVDIDAPPQVNSIAASHVERLDDFATPGGKGYEAQADALERELVEGEAVRTAPATEATEAGEQMLMEGVEAITGAQRAQAAVDAPIEGGDAPMNIGLFDEAARDQTDLLDMMIPTGRMLEDAQGKQTPEMRRVEDEFREIEQDQSMLDRLEGCVKK